MVQVKEIHKKAERQFKSYLLSILHDTDFFPLVIRADKGSALDDFQARKTDVDDLYKNSKSVKGYGYVVEASQVNTRKRGLQTVLDTIFFETEKDYLRFIKKEQETIEFKYAVNLIRERFNTSVNTDVWLEKNILQLATPYENNYWQNVLNCVEWFLENPNSELYIREIPVTVHTKFIENNIRMIFSLYCFLKHIDDSEVKKITDIYKVLGVITAESLIRFRVLDDSFFINILSQNISSSEILLPIKSFSELKLEDVQNIFIVENLLVYLTFPNVKNSLCIFGSGYASVRLKACANMKSKNIFYFGDIDEHGFEILSDVRNIFPQTKSFCMDENTYNLFFEFTVQGKKSKRKQDDFNLTDEELKLFKLISQSKQNGRLEQERISQSYIKEALCKIMI